MMRQLAGWSLGLFLITSNDDNKKKRSVEEIRVACRVMRRSQFVDVQTIEYYQTRNEKGLPVFFSFSLPSLSLFFYPSAMLVLDPSRPEFPQFAITSTKLQSQPRVLFVFIGYSKFPKLECVRYLRLYRPWYQYIHRISNFRRVIQNPRQ